MSSVVNYKDFLFVYETWPHESFSELFLIVLLESMWIEEETIGQLLLLLQKKLPVIFFDWSLSVCEIPLHLGRGMEF